MRFFFCLFVWGLSCVHSEMQLEEAGLESLTGMDIPDGLLFASTPGASLNHPTLQTTLGYVTPKVATV